MRSLTWRAQAGILCLALVFSACGGGGKARDADPTPADRQPRPLLVLGIDGATWDLIDPMMERGELPNLKRLVERGIRGDLVSLPPLSSPPLWTTMATGRFTRDHNVYDHTYPFVPGAKRRVRSTERRVPAIWNIASDAGRQVAVVGYFASHPPEVVNGVMISDQSARGVPGGFYPQEIEAELQPILEGLKDKEEARKLHERYLPWPFQASAIKRPDDPYHRVTEVVRGRIGNHVVWEEFLRRAALHLAPRDFDLFMVYLRMPDHASHATWLYFDESTFDQKPEPFDRDLLKDIIPTSYRDSDEYLGQLLDQLESEVNLVILSDHGFGPSSGKWHPERDLQELRLLSGSHRPDGIFLAAGPDIRPGEVEGFTVMDVAPTLFALLGLPVSKELPGRVMTEILQPDFLNGFPVRETAAYRNRWQPVESAEEASAETQIEDLKILTALGYLDSEPPLASADTGQDLDVWSIEPRLRWNTIIGEILFHLQRDQRSSVDELMSLVEANDPVWRRSLPRNVRKRKELWQNSFDFPVVSDATWQWFEATYGKKPKDG